MSMNTDKNELLENTGKIHTTAMGIDRMRNCSRYANHMASMHPA